MKRPGQLRSDPAKTRAWRARSKPLTNRRSRAGRAEDRQLARSKRIVAARSNGRCEARTPDCTGTAHHYHHLTPKGLGGRGDHTPENLLHIDASCHRWIHDHPTASYRAGWLRKRQ